MTARTCQSCAAWRPWGTQRVLREGGAVGDEPIGQCRRQAPTIDPEAITGTSAAWPVVAADDWCLEHRDRPETARLSHQNPVARSGATPWPSGQRGRDA